MKKRLGFVSNSSSSSYLIDTEKSVEEFSAWLKGVIKAVYEIQSEDDLNTFIRTCCTISETDHSGNDFLSSIEDFWSVGDERVQNDLGAEFVARMKRDLEAHRKYFYDFMERVEKRGLRHLIRVDSVGDNSIPCCIQEMLEERFPNNIREHWG